MIRSRALQIVSALIYFCVLGYFAFRPFIPIPGLMYPDIEVELKDGAVALAKGASLELPGASAVRKGVKQTGEISVETLLQVSSEELEGGRCIFSFTEHSAQIHFIVYQLDRGIGFRIHTDKTPYTGIYKGLLVEDVLSPMKPNHIVATYDGQVMRLYVEGFFKAQTEIEGNDSHGWTNGRVLTLGDQVSGGSPWVGRVFRLAVYNRAVDLGEVQQMQAGKAVPGIILDEDFSRWADGRPIKKMRYRNLFTLQEPYELSVMDLVANVLAFIPLAFMISPWAGRRFMLIVLCGFLISLGFEWSQRSIVNRVPCLADLIYNVSGTMIGYALLLKWQMLQQKRSRPE